MKRKKNRTHTQNPIPCPREDFYDIETRGSQLSVYASHMLAMPCECAFLTSLALYVQNLLVRPTPIRLTFRASLFVYRPRACEGPY